MTETEPTAPFGSPRRSSDCPANGSFWEPGGAVVEGVCLLERLDVDLTRPGLAEYLLETRERLGADERSRKRPRRRTASSRGASDEMSRKEE